MHFATSSCEESRAIFTVARKLNDRQRILSRIVLMPFLSIPFGSSTYPSEHDYEDTHQLTLSDERQRELSA